MNFQRSMAVAILMIVALGPRAAAQEGEAAPGAPAGKAEKYKDWTLLCSEATGNAPQVCEIGTVLVSDKGQRLGALAVASIAEPGGTGTRMIASALVPLGVDLRSNPTLTVGTGQPMTLTFLRCLERGCEASAPLAEDQQAALRAGTTAQVAVAVGGEKKATFDFSLSGFSAAHDALKKRLGAK